MQESGETKPLLDGREGRRRSYVPPGATYSPVPEETTPQSGDGDGMAGSQGSISVPIPVPRVQSDYSMGNSYFSYPGQGLENLGPQGNSLPGPPRRSSSISIQGSPTGYGQPEPSPGLRPAFSESFMQGFQLDSPTHGTKGLGRSPSGHHDDHHPEEPLIEFDPDFDISSKFLMKLFNMLDKDGNGRLTYDELREGLSSVRGMHELPPHRVLQVISMIDQDKSHDISQEEFVQAFQHLATKFWSRNVGTNLLELFVYDFGPETAVCRWIFSKGQDEFVDAEQLEASLDDFFHEPEEEVKPGDVRWISVTGVDPSVIVRLANRYKLHPLLVEDVISTDKERMKVDRSGSVLQVLLGRCLLVETSAGFPAIRKEQVTLFLVEDQNIVISIQRSPSEINNLLLARIMYAGSKLRLNGPRFLVYAIVDSAVDELFPILRTLRKKLKTLHTDVTSHSKTSLSTVHCIQHIIREVNLLNLWLSPLGTVASRLMSELPTEGDSEMRKHLEDLLDHVHALKEQTSSMAGWAKSLNDEYLNEQSYRMNQVIYLLTMVTAIVMPAQFFTGVFGMNFNEMPLIREPYGFLVFIGMTIAVSATILMVFRLQGWL